MLTSQCSYKRGLLDIFQAYHATLDKFKKELICAHAITYQDVSSSAVSPLGCFDTQSLNDIEFTAELSLFRRHFFIDIDPQPGTQAAVHVALADFRRARKHFMHQRREMVLFLDAEGGA